MATPVVNLLFKKAMGSTENNIPKYYYYKKTIGNYVDNCNNISTAFLNFRYEN